MTDDLLAHLQAARFIEERTLIVTHDLLESVAPPLRAAAWTAAAPHWFDGNVLAALLDVSLEEAGRLYVELQTLPFVEPFRGRGHNVHELARRAMLADWWAARRDEYRALCARAVAYFGQQDEPAWQIERTYHLLLADEDAGADALCRLGAGWNDAFQYDLLHALAQAGMEHVEAGRLAGRGAGWALFRQGQVEARGYRHAEAKAAFERALDYAGDDDHLRADALLSLGDMHVMLDEYGAARERYEAALPIYRTIGGRLGEANAIKGLGDVHYGLDEYGAARERYEAVLPLYRAIGARLGEANALKSLGDVHRMLDEYGAARERYEAALVLYRMIGDRLGEANAMKSLGDVHYCLDEHEAAWERYEAALLTYRIIGDRLGEEDVIYSLGNMYVEEYGDVETRYISGSTDIRLLALDVVADRCARETGLLFRGRSCDPQYCFELFRRAIVERNQRAWELVYDQYRPLVTGWVHRHPAFLASGEEAQYFVNRAFEKMWVALTPERFGRFSNLKSLLRYLQTCVHNVILDQVRAAKQIIMDVQAGVSPDEDRTRDPFVEHQALERMSTQEFWEGISARLSNEKERLVIYGSFFLALKPRELYAQFQNVFDSVNEVYQVRNNVLARLRRDAELRELIDQNA